MYESFYGLSSKPFQLNPDPGFYFGSKQHRRAKAYLEYGVQRNEGFIVITGEIGAGKTTVIRGLLSSIDSKKVVAANLVTTQLDAEDTLRLVGAAFGVRVKDSSKADVLMALEAYLVNQVSQGKRCLLIVDEAQNLTPRAVEELRMLSNFQLGQQALLQTFLVGQPEFRAILQSPNMQQLRQRVTATCHIGPLAQDETQCYIQHRLKCAGAEGRPTFESEAFEGIHKAAGGLPRRVNLICDRLLLLGFFGKRDHFGIVDVDEVVKEIKDETTVSMVGGPEKLSEMSKFDQLGLRKADVVDIEPPKFQIPPALAETMSSQIESLTGEQYEGRLMRLERSVLRMERIELEILVMLQKLVVAVKSPAQESVT